MSGIRDLGTTFRKARSLQEGRLPPRGSGQRSSRCGTRPHVRHPSMNCLTRIGSTGAPADPFSLNQLPTMAPSAMDGCSWHVSAVIPAPTRIAESPSSSLNWHVPDGVGYSVAPVPVLGWHGLEDHAHLTWLEPGEVPGMGVVRRGRSSARASKAAPSTVCRMRHPKAGASAGPLPRQMANHGTSGCDDGAAPIAWAELACGRPGGSQCAVR